MKPATVEWLWVPLRQVQLARQVNWAASGASDSASRAPSRAATLTPLSTGLSVMVIGVSLVWMGTDGRLSLLPAGTEHDGEREEAAQDKTVAVRAGERVAVGGEPQVRVTAEQGLEGDFGFEPGQGAPRQ